MVAGASLDLLLTDAVSQADECATGFERHQLAAMPLSGVSERFGVVGLIKRFNLAIDHQPLADQRRCRFALALALYLHRHDRYKGAPYITHLLRVAIRLHRTYGVNDPDVLSAAVLHDSLEDHADDLVRLGPLLDPAVGPSTDDALPTAVAILARLTTERVATLVQGVTNPPRPPGLSAQEKREVYTENVQRKISESFDIFLIKLSDFTDNAVGAHWTEDPSRAKSLCEKYLPVFDVFMQQVAAYEISGQLAPQLADGARGQLRRGRENCLAVRAM